MVATGKGKASSKTSQKRMTLVFTPPSCGTKTSGRESKVGDLHPVRFSFFIFCKEFCFLQFVLEHYQFWIWDIW